MRNVFINMARNMTPNMIRPGCLLLILAWISLTACSGFITEDDIPHATAEAKADYARALSAMKDGDDEEAKGLFQAMTNKYPKLAGAYINLGLLSLKAENLAMAEKNLGHAVKLNPKNALAQNHLGVVYRHLGRFAEARKAYQRALEINGDYALAHINLGILYDIYIQDLASALEHYEQYQALTDNTDKLVMKWIVDLKRRQTAKNTAGENKG